MKTLADEIMELVPMGTAINAIAKIVSADTLSVRRAVQKLDDEKRACILRQGKKLFLVAEDRSRPICRHCHVAFVRPSHSKRKCCSRSCGIAWSWSRPGVRERRRAALSIAQSTPEALARTAEHNRRRWSRPEEHAKLSEQNRREWADPAKAAKRAAGIRAAHGSAEMRRHYSEMRKADWRNEEFRGKTVKAMRKQQATPTTREKHSEANRRRYCGDKREKYLAASLRNIAKATEAIRGKKRRPESIRKGVETRNARLRPPVSHETLLGQNWIK